VLVATALSYATALSGGFVYDDELQILRNPLLADWANLARAFTGDVWRFYTAPLPGVHAAYYRPLFTVYLTLGWHAFGAHPLPWHVASLVVHLLSTALAYGVVRRMLSPPYAAFAAALFGLHPLHVESVAWISGVTDPLMSCFLLGSLLMSTRPGLRARSAALVLAAAAMLTKETAFVLVAMAPLLALAVEGAVGHRRRQAARLGAALVLVAAVVFAARYAVIGYVTPRHESWVTRPGSWYLALPGVLCADVALLVAPIHLSLWYPPPSAVTGLGLAATLFAALAVLLAVAWSRTRVVLAAFAFLLPPLLPVLNLGAFHPGDALHDRYLYVPVLGLAILAGAALARISQRRSVPAVLGLGILLGAAALSLTRSRDWASDERLFLAAVGVAPTNPLALEAAGGIHAKRGEHALARGEFEAAIAADPARADALSQLALLDAAEGRDAATALMRARRAADLMPNAYHLKNLALVHLWRSEADESVPLLRRVLQLEPSEVHRRLLARAEAASGAGP